MKAVFLLLVILLIHPLPAGADGIIVIGDSWAQPVGDKLGEVLQEQGHGNVPVHLTPYWGGPRNLDSFVGRESIREWLETWPNATHIYMMMGQNNWLCCWTTDMIGTQDEDELFESIIGHLDNVLDIIWSIRPDMRIVWTAGEYFRPHHLGTPTQVNRSHDKLAQLAVEYVADKGPELTFLDWNGTLQVEFGFDGVQHTQYDPDHAIPAGDPSLPDPTLPSPAAAYRNPAHPNLTGYKTLAQAVYDRYFEAELTTAKIGINQGMSDAWFGNATPGQGFLVVVFPDTGIVFLAWFTYDTERPPQDVTALLGEAGHRWVTAQGPYDGDTATLTVYLTQGGVFDMAEPPAVTDTENPIGTITITWHDCANATLSYEIDPPGVMGEIPLRRIVPDNEALCEMFDGM